LNSIKNNLELTGYVTVRRFGGYALPVPIQNRLLKTYCEEHNFSYTLPLCELYLPNNYMALHKTIDKCPESSNIGMCSIYMFPSEIEKFLSLKTKIDKKELLFHFIFENRVVKSDKLEEFFHDSRLRYMFNNNDQYVGSLEDIFLTND
tara:strand:+ start:839 stop:1282 length:444 start_codon:yes stop_codon:yes gene_type:complete